MHTLADILVIDDTVENLHLLTALLSDCGYKVRPAMNGTIALRAARSLTPDLILLDIVLPDQSGYEICAALKADPALRDVPVIFISAIDDTLDKVRAFRAGGVDYITKPFQVEEVLARIETHLTIQRQQRDLQALNATKDDLVRMVSHDLKNPLTAVRGYIDLLDRIVPSETPHVRECIAGVRQASQRMLQIISALLDLARIEAGLTLQLEATHLDQFLGQCCDELRSIAAQKGVTLHCPPSATAAWSALDRLHMYQAVSNLLSNAIKYTPAGGSVFVSTEVLGERVRIVVRDTGIGIPAAHLPRIFDRFYRVSHPQHDAQVGTGLGLAIVRGLIERHGGRVEVASREGLGSTFTIELACLPSTLASPLSGALA